MAASGVGAAIALAADRRRAARRDRLPRHAGRGAGQRQADHDRGRPVRRASTRRCCTTRATARHVESHPLASEDVDVVFHGLQSHASSDPWMGRNALDALIVLFTSVGLWRQQLRPTARVHGIIREGGTAANIIPDRASAWFMIRSDDEADYEVMRDALPRRCVEAAALATDTTVEVTFSGRATTMRNNGVLAERFRANMARLRDRGPGRRPRTPARPTWPTSAGSARPSTRTSRSRPRARPATRSCSATRRSRRGPTRRRSWRPRSSPRPRYDLFRDPQPCRGRLAEFRDGEAVTRRPRARDA